MRKKMIAMLFVLILTLSGCADVSTAPEESDNYELVTGTEAAAEAESTESSSFSESTIGTMFFTVGCLDWDNYTCPYYSI